MQSLFCLAVSSLALVASAIPTESFADVVPRASNPNTATVPNQPPAVPPNLQDCDFKFYTQAIDHFGQHNGTFQQKYNLVTDFFKPGGPIFFYQGEEQTYLDCVDTSIAYTWAKETNGIAVVLEHRYFGVSVPFGVDNPANATQQPYFDYLTLDNVLEDGVTFLESVKKNVTGAQDSKVIVLSGSYGGFLSTMYRQNHPDAIYGAIASAPPVEDMTNNSNSAYYYNWNIWLNNVYQDRSAEASAKIKKAINTFEQRFASGDNLTSLKTELGLCYEPTKDEGAAIMSWIQQVYDNAAEFNYATLRGGRASVALGLDLVVNITLAQDDPIQILNETLWMWMEPLNFTCLDYRDSLAEYALVPLIQQEIFLYLSCKYLPMNGLPNVPNGTIFHAIDAAATAVSNCDARYNVSTPSADQLRTQYKYTEADLRESTRIIWSLGQYDPTGGVSPNQPGINAPAMSTDRNVSRVLYTSNMAHREDLFAPDPSDRDEVVRTRNIELESIKGWLGWYDL